MWRLQIATQHWARYKRSAWNKFVWGARHVADLCSKFYRRELNFWINKLSGILWHLLKYFAEIFILAFKILSRHLKDAACSVTC